MIAKPIAHSTGVIQKETTIRNKQARVKKMGSKRLTWTQETRKGWEVSQGESETEASYSQLKFMSLQCVCLVLTWEGKCLDSETDPVQIIPLMAHNCE